MISKAASYIKSLAGAERKLLVFVLATSLLILLVGLTTDLRYSDEIFHFWFAKEWFEKGSRPVYNELVDTVKEFHYYRHYGNAPLWHYGLCNLMTIFGPSKAIAQVYQLFFFTLLMLGTYLLAKELYGRETAWYAVVVVATLPVFVSLSVLFFIDVPIASLTPFLLLALIKQRTILAGLVLGAMFLMKENAYFLVPSMVAIILVPWGIQIMSEGVLNRALRAMLILLLAFVINIPDLLFRYEKFGTIGLRDPTVLLHRQTWENAVKFRHLPSKGQTKTVSNIYLTESVTLPGNIFKFLGVCLPFTFVISLVCNRYEKKDLWLLLPCFIYAPLYFFFFKDYYAVRYLSPILPLLGIFTAKVLEKGLVNKSLKTTVLLICFAQMLATLGYVSSERRISSAKEEGLGYINSQVPVGIRILTPEELFVSYCTGRPTLWVNSFNREEFYKLLWGEKAEAKTLLEKYKIKYILVQRHRIYDDSSIKHYGGFPSSFVEKRLPLLACNVWGNEYMSIWEVPSS